MQQRTKSTGVTILVIIVVLVVVILGVGGGILYSMLKPGGPNTIRVTANQYYEGDLDRTLLHIVFEKEGYDPVNTTQTSSTVGFGPFCGAPGSEEATTTSALFASGYFILNGDNTTVRLVTKNKSNNETNRNMLEDTTNCAFDKIATLMKDDLNMSLVNQKIDMKKYTTPGFETILMVPAMVVISLIWRRRMRGQKK